MEDALEQFGRAGADITFITFPFVLLLLTACAIILCGSKRVVVPVFLLAVLFLPPKQRLVLMGLDFTAMRILLLCALAAMVRLGEHHALTRNRADKVLIGFVALLSLAYCLLRLNFGAVINRSGYVLDILGLYFLFRMVLRHEEDYRALIRFLAVIALLLAGVMLIEYLTQRNPLAFLGAVSETTQERSGRLRCQAAFGHPILAGNVGALLMPVFFASWRVVDRSRLLFAGATVASVLIVIFSGSSGPVMSLLAGAGALGLWHARDHMRLIRRVTTITLVFMHVVMKAPIWALIWRASIIGGSTGYHRYKLVDQFVNHFSEWWLFGTLSTFGWGYFLFDVANQYVAIGVDGGLGALIMAIWLWVCLFLCISQVLAFEGLTDGQRFLVWSFGCALFTLLVSYFGVSYYDQSRVILYIVLALCASAPEAFGAAAESEPDAAAEQTPNPDVTPGMPAR